MITNDDTVFTFLDDLAHRNLSGEDATLTPTGSLVLNSSRRHIGHAKRLAVELQRNCRGSSANDSESPTNPGSGTGGSAIVTINGGPPPPTFSLAGDMYGSAQRLSVSDVTPKAVIYHTTNGT